MFLVRSADDTGAGIVGEPHAPANLLYSAGFRCARFSILIGDA